MSRNKNTSNEKENLIRYNFKSDDPKSNENFQKKEHTKESLLDLKKIRTEKDDEISNIESLNEYNEIGEIERKYESIRNVLPKKDYINMFDDEYMTFFEDEKNLEIFGDIINILNNFDLQESSILNEIRDKIDIGIIDEFNCNLIRIYRDLKIFYNKFKDQDIFNENFIELLERKENLNYFDKLYKNIKINLFRKTGNLSAFSKTFFSFIDIKILKFFNRIFMIRVFIRIKNDEEPFYSIINEKNYISKESLTYITKAIIHEKECNGDTQKFLDYFE